VYSLSSASQERARPRLNAPSGKAVVVVIDDDVSVRESLELLIASAGWQPATYSSAKDFLDSYPAEPPSCLVLDVNLPGLTGLELQGMLSSHGRRVPIIFVTGFGDVPMTVRAMKAGAVEFLTKPIDTTALLAAIGSAVEQSVARVREDEEISRVKARYQTLSQREREVLTCVVKGLLNKQAAFQLGISEITVKAHRGQMMRKMGARSVPDLVHMATLLDGPDDAGPRNADEIL